MPKATSVDDYIALQPKATQEKLERVRSALRKALPGATEVIAYQMPAYRASGRIVIYFAGWKEHYALYVPSVPLRTAFKKELARYEIHKATIRFPMTEPVPVKLIERIAKFRAKELAEKKS